MIAIALCQVSLQRKRLTFGNRLIPNTECGLLTLPKVPGIRDHVLISPFPLHKVHLDPSDILVRPEFASLDHGAVAAVSMVPPTE